MARPTLRISSLLVIALACFLQGCGVNIPEGKYRCDEVTACPKDYQCRAGLCSRSGDGSSTLSVAKNIPGNGGPSSSDTDSSVAGAAASAAHGGGVGTTVQGGAGGNPGSGGATAQGGAAAQGGATAQGGGTGAADSAADPSDSSECVLGEAKLGACTLL